jgi:two-component system NtrC family sensor kinase
MNHGFEAGADDFVSKSSDLGVLRARIQALMRRRFFQEENARIVDELKTRESEILRARAGREVAETRAAMADELVRANRDLQELNRKLKDAQTQLIRNEKLASLGQLVAGIAHEINNPMAFVLNNFFIVETGLDALLPEIRLTLASPSFAHLQKTRLRLGEMREGLDRVKDIVRDLRTFSRSDEGELQVVDISETINTVLLLLKHRMNGRILIEKRYAEVNTLYCYAGRLHQVFMNLVANAVDAFVESGKIVITTSQDSQSFLISVRDDGPGIPEAIRGKIFDPFFTTKPVGKGTGLGLAISYGIVADHHGSIEVESQPGVGTEFIVRIPLNLQLQGDK